MAAFVLLAHMKHAFFPTDTDAPVFGWHNSHQQVRTISGGNASTYEFFIES
jgi:hypothetical protein